MSALRSSVTRRQEWTDTSNTLHLPITPEGASVARGFVRRCAEEAGLPMEDVEDVTLAVGEAVANALEHGTPQTVEKESAIVLQVLIENNSFVVLVRDFGAGFDVDMQNRLPVSPMAERGRGLMLMRILMDRVVFSRLPDGMSVRLEKRMTNSI